ncbi:tetratricopeptide repeat protein [Planctomyces sp. SH-PL14]|uniref:tetratricopeptide repeat protein n=1 Tax=Planctomyces sp. SH-PL14 TaxID=1632864 RepID=UPI00078D2422|nr:PLD nuclease N-terminal domain-containing protein [Planctomyces sp. SH-PL14]AMV19765.1 tetratricopeptide repeat protein [Planctomyces sp. SH-PL14]
MNLLTLAQDVLPPVPRDFGWQHALWKQLVGLGPWVYLPFLLWMAYVCVRDDPEARAWIWIILVIQPFGPFLYFFARYIPTRDWHGPKWLRRFTRGSEIRRKEIAAHNIGNAHQFVELGDARREVGQWDGACESYDQALAKEPDNIAALWGAGQCEFQAKHFEEAKAHLAAVLKKDPAYKFGDVSLLQGRVLQALGDDPAAIAHLREHTRRWRHPEALYILADLLARQGEAAEARRLLDGLLMDLEAAPKAIARKQMFWKGRAKRLRRTLPKA